ncbi:MAG TPA: hypothetical protein DCF33_18945 [Saprospirales bacterium]|nr:hypothetical protein [Saprospirales bacterium]
MKTFPMISAITALLLVFVQAFAVNYLADEFRIMGDRNWFPGLIYGISASAFPEYLVVSAPLVAATIVPFGLMKIFHAFQKPNVHSTILDSGLWLSAGCLIYPPMVWLLVAGFAGLSVVRVFRLKEMFIYAFGTLIPFFWGWLWYFWTDRGSEFREVQMGGLFQMVNFNILWKEIGMLNASMLGVYILLLLLALPNVLNKKGIQIQKYVGVLLWFLVAGIFSVALQGSWHWSSWIVAVTPLSLLLVLGCQDFFKKWWIEIAHLVILAFILILQYANHLLPYLQYL